MFLYFFNQTLPVEWKMNFMVMCNAKSCTLFQGNAELLSISSDDSIWNSEDEEDDRQSDSVAGEQ